MARLLIADVLTKAPTLAHNHFLEVMFLLNGAAAAWRAARRGGGGGGDEGHLGTADFAPALQARLAGQSDGSRARRFAIYRVRRGLPRSTGRTRT